MAKKPITKWTMTLWNDETRPTLWRWRAVRYDPETCHNLVVEEGQEVGFLDATVQAKIAQLRYEKKIQQDGR